MRHHYVPEFLQKPWTENTSDGKLEVFRLDLSHVPSLRHTPKHTGFDDNLYALTKDAVAGMDQQAVEKLFLRNVDNSAALVRNKLERQGLMSLTLEDKVHWTRFIMSLPFRQPDIVHLLKQSATENLKESLNEDPEEYEELNSAGDPLSLEELTEKEYPGLIENFGLSFFDQLVDNPLYGNKILNMNWWLWDFQDVPYELLLSDHPCMFTSGIDDPKCIIALPISPKKAFMAIQSDQIAKTLRRVKPKDLVMLINESIFMQARVRIYARNQLPARRFIENRMHKRKIR
jgi:hypothetical protein